MALERKGRKRAPFCLRSKRKGHFLIPNFEASTNLLETFFDQGQIEHAAAM
jgi:hypothetical protein